MTIKKIYFLALSLFALASSNAQQDPNFTFYNYGMSLINPAYSGADNATDITVGVRSQWAGVQGAPESQRAVFSTPLGKGLGIGVSVLNDKTFIEKQTWLGVDFSYQLQLNSTTNLNLGIKASGSSYNANTDGLVTYGVGQDASLSTFNSSFMPNIGIGAYLRGTSYFVSLSAPKLLTPDRLEEQNGVVLAGQERRHIYLSGGYDFPLGGSTILHATTMLRHVADSPLSAELTGILEFDFKFNIGAAYRYQESFAGLLFFKVSPTVDLGYAYEVVGQNAGVKLNNTHELLLRVKFTKNTSTADKED